MKKFTIIVGILILLGSIVWLGAKDALVPLDRQAIQRPLYTVAETMAMDSERPPLVFGRAFWGAYPGARAFPSVEAAHQFLVAEGKQDRAWSIYRLSGDYELDTYDYRGSRYTARSLLAIEAVD